MKFRSLRAPVVNGDADEYVFRIGLRILDKHIEIPVAIKRSGIEEFVLHLLPRPAPVRFEQVAIGKFLLRVLVEILHIGMCRCAVKIEVVFLDVLAVIAFAVGQTEQAFF